MKTPEELYGKHGSRRFGLMSMVDFTKALTEDRQQIKDMIEGVFDDYEYDDEHYIITPHILKLQELIRSKL